MRTRSRMRSRTRMKRARSEQGTHMCLMGLGCLWMGRARSRLA